MKKIHKTAVVAAILGLLLLGACKSTKIIYPTINDSPAALNLQGKMIWYDLHTTDMTSAQNFYENLLGWDMERTNDLYPRYKTIYHRGRPIGTMIGRDAEPGDSEWISCMSVPAVDVMIELVEETGGTVESPPTQMPDRGQQAVILDPQGARIGLLTSSTGDPVDAAFVLNRFMGSELWTTAPAKATEFYVKLAQYQASDEDGDTTMPYTLLATRGRPRATVNKMLTPNAKPMWIPLVLVDDLDALLAKVPQFEGTIVLAPNREFRHGRAAVVRDPSGAYITVQQAAGPRQP